MLYYNIEVMARYTGVAWKVEQIQLLLEESPHMTMAKAATHLHCSREYVRQLKNRFNLPFKRRGKPECWVCGEAMSYYSRAESPCHQKCSHAPVAISKALWNRVAVQEPDACWEWQGTRFPSGYGHFSHNRYAHRLVWELTYGPVPKGAGVCHTCDNPPCCNPDHLFLGTQKDNVADMLHKGRGRHQRYPQKRHQKTHCTHGHAFTPENTYITPGDQRQCRECTNTRQRR